GAYSQYATKHTQKATPQIKCMGAKTPKRFPTALLSHDRCLLPADRRGPLVGEQEAHELLYRGRKALASHVDDAPGPEDGKARHLNHHQAALPAFELDRVSGEHRNPQSRLDRVLDRT